MTCLRCGVCCAWLRAPLEEEDVERASSYLGMSATAFLSTYAEKVPIREGYLLQADINGCVFLARENDGRATCTIYQARPRVCREWQPNLSRSECAEGLAKLTSTKRDK